MEIKKINNKNLIVMGQCDSCTYSENDCEHDCKSTQWSGNKSAGNCHQVISGNGHWSDSK